MNTTDKKRDKVSVFYEEMEKLTGCKIFRDLLRKESPVVADVIWNSMRTYADRQVAAALSSGGSNCIEGDEEKVQKLRKICSVWLRSYNNVYESTNEMVDEILEVINDN